MAPKPEQSLVGAGAGVRIFSCRGLIPAFLGIITPRQRGGDDVLELKVARRSGGLRRGRSGGRNL